MAKKRDGKPSPGGSGDRRARVAAMQAEEARRERRRRLITWGGITVAGLVVVGGIAAAVVVNSGGAKSPTVPAHPRTTSEGRTTAPPWAAPGDPSAAVKAAGLPMLGGEGSAEHIHAHLDVYADGKPVQVPQLIGIDESAGTLSPLHTHDTTGVVHIESPVKADFSLGQFMTEWQVSMSADHLGGLKTDATHTLTAYVNGKAVGGDPSAIIFAAHDEIALVYGTSAENSRISVPKSYSWTSGL